MKTNELIEKVKHLGLETKCDEHKIEINDKNGITVCLISRKHCFIFTTDYYVNEKFPYSFKEALLGIVCQYASTPIEEREIEPKYKLFLREANNWFVESPHCVYTKKEWEDEFKVSWETITSIYQPIMIN